MIVVEEDRNYLFSAKKANQNWSIKKIIINWLYLINEVLRSKWSFLKVSFAVKIYAHHFDQRWRGEEMMRWCELDSGDFSLYYFSSNLTNLLLSLNSPVVQYPSPSLDPLSRRFWWGTWPQSLEFMLMDHPLVVVVSGALLYFTFFCVKLNLSFLLFRFRLTGRYVHLNTTHLVFLTF